MKTTDYLADAKKRLKISSDYGMAKHLGITRGAMSNYKNGIRTIDNATCVKLAEILEIDPMEIIATASLERETTPEGKSFWKTFLEQSGTNHLVLMLVILAGVSFSVTPSNSYAYEDSSFLQDYTLCTL